MSLWLLGNWSQQCDREICTACAFCKTSWLVDGRYQHTVQSEDGRSTPEVKLLSTLEREVVLQNHLNWLIGLCDMSYGFRFLA